MDGLGDVAAGGMGGDIGTSEQEYSDCIVSQMLRMECPSYVSHFSLGRTTDGSLGIVAAQKGTDGLNESASAYADTRAHAHFYLFDNKLKPALALQTPAAGKQLSFTIAPGNQDHELDLITHTGEENAEPGLVWSPLLDKSSSVSLAESGSLGFGLGAAVRGKTGSAVYYETASDESFVITGVPDDPQTIQLTKTALRLAVDIDQAGLPHALVFDGSMLHLLGGAELDEVEWSKESSDDGALDLLYGLSKAPQRKYILVGDSLTVVQEDEASPAVSLSTFENGCDLWKIKFDCDSCPIGTACENSQNVSRGARLFAAGNRALLAVVSREYIDKRVTDTDVSPFFICLCDSKSVENAATADYLTIYEVHYHGIEQAPSLTPIHRQLIGDGHGASLFGLVRDSQRGLDVWYGPQLIKSEGTIGTRFPEVGTQFVIEHLQGFAH